jgi:hypothetical protein
MEGRMRNSLTAIVAGIALLVSGAPVFAHHPFSDDFDVNKPILLAGRVTRVEWTSPHGMLYLNVMDENGKSSNWVFELGNPEDLMKAGWTRDALKANTVVVVEGWRAKDASKKFGNAKTVILAGKSMDARSSMTTTKKAPGITQ